MMVMDALSLVNGHSDVLVAVSFILLTFLFFRSRVRRTPLPPGPKASWWFGKVALPKVAPWRTLASWRETYGR